ncbi:uncharacterized protein LOC113157116 isoform X1 [Anabas testudineus]|uniref:uncharacterized protein LOC113157116 isoform X1 n=1 Tax=Anabas testudineus TaxID=64144 RepID=UPI00143D321C|nr:uncharacterized protein LOC113157116 isoform X1 [Anabas testudineus]
MKLRSFSVGIMMRGQQRNLSFFTMVSFLLMPSSPAAGVQIRLSGSGSTQCSGRVEIYHNNTWGTVCDDEWDLNDAMVVCRELNCGAALDATQLAQFGEGTGQIWLDDVACSGNEWSLTECQHRGFGTHDCRHREDAGVICSGMRLSGSGSTLCSGRVEIYHNNIWGTVCDDSWDLNDAMVVCRELRCGTALSAPQSAKFGEGTGQIWLDDVTCSGSESFLTECQHSGFGKHNCKHNEDAGVICSASLPKPSISMNPAGEVNWGQDVGITCSISTQLLGGTFILQKTSGSFRKTQTSSTNSATFNIPKVNFDNEGSYQCQYEKRTESQTFRSNLSDSVRISVTVTFPKPSISMNPASEVNWGQDVGITCSVSTQLLGGTFILQKTSGSFRETKTSSTNSATFNISEVDFDKEGLYQCQYKYQKRGSTDEFSSPQSNSIRLSITVHLQTPSISLTSPDGGLVLSPEAAQVTRGSSFVITCSINSIYPDGRFFLIFSGSNITSKSAVDHSASFNFRVAEYKHQGNYSCVYEVTLSTWKFNSTETESISVIIKLPLLLLVTSVAVGALLLALLVLLVVCLVCRRRRRAKKPATLIFSQLAVTDNYYGDDDDGDDDDDDQDYVNVDQMDTKKKVKEKVGKVEEEENDDYEDLESDEDHDYEEAGPDENNTEAKKICFSVKDCRDDEKTLKEESGRKEEEESDDYENLESDEDHDYEEAGPDETNTEAKEVYRDSEVVDDNEESETSDDEDDYVNVNVPLCEQTNVNIYREK